MLFDVLSSLYAYFYSANFSKLKEYTLIRLLFNGIAKVLESLIENSTWLIKFPRQPLQKGNDIIVSLTTFPKRFSSVKFVLYTILRQSVRPECIIVNLTKEECPNGRDDLPNDLKLLEKYGVKFIFRDENLLPHGKYFYTLQEYPDKLVITFDDDILYRKDAIEKLLRLHESNPKAVCARIVRQIKISNDKILPYSSWEIYNNNIAGLNYIALGFGGVLYPSQLFSKSNLFNIEDIKKYSLRADDLWLKANEILLNIPVVSGKFEAPDVALNTSSISALSSDNVGQSANDFQWSTLDNILGINTLLIR